MRMGLSVYGGFRLGLALNPTPNPYRKPRAMSYPPPLYAGQVYRTNIMKPSQPIMWSTHTHTHTLANVAQQSHKIIPKLYRLQCCYGSKYGNSGHFRGLQSRATSKYGFSGHQSILNLVREAAILNLYSSPPPCGAGVPVEDNEAISTHNVINTHTHTHTHTRRIHYCSIGRLVWQSRVARLCAI